MGSPFARIVAGPLGRALATRNARIFFGASLGAWTGLWMHRIGVAWLAWELSRSAAWVGLIAFADLAPAVLVSPVAGALADRVDRVRLTMVSQGVIAAEALTVAALTATGGISIGLLFALELVSGSAASFAQPARQTLIPALVPREDLPAAVATNSLLFNVARFIGPGVAGAVIAAWGVAPAILCNALGQTFASLSMPWLRVDAAQRRGHPATNSLLAETLEGFRYVARHPGLGPIIAFSAATSVLLRGVQEILPPYVERLFSRGAELLAALTACFAVGALVSGLVVASRGRLAGTTRIAVLAILAQAAATAAFVATGCLPRGHALRGPHRGGGLGARHLRAGAGADGGLAGHAGTDHVALGPRQPRLPGARGARPRHGGGGLRAPPAHPGGRPAGGRDLRLGPLPHGRDRPTTRGTEGDAVMLDAALVGMGRWGQTLANSVQGRNGTGLRFVAGATRSPDKARGWAAEKGIDLLPDLDAVLADPRVKAVVLATPHRQHAAQVVAAARAGRTSSSRSPSPSRRPRPRRRSRPAGRRVWSSRSVTTGASCRPSPR